MNYYTKLSEKTIIDLTSVTIYERNETNVTIYSMSGGDVLGRHGEEADVLWSELETLCSATIFRRAKSAKGS